MKISHVVFLGVLILILFGVGVYTSRDTIRELVTGVASHNDIEKLQPSGTLPYTHLEGNSVTLNDFLGKTVVVNAWASWCPFCKDELPHFAELAQEFKDKDVVILAINRAESPDTVRAYFEYIGKPEELIFLLDPQDTFYKTVGGFAMPETIFYRSDGTIASHARGSMTTEEIRERILGALEKAD